MMKIKINKLHEKRNWTCTPTQLIVIGFFAVIMTGTLLLCLPFATASGESASFVNALFTATTSVCVTGLVVVETASYWSLFGKIVILLLIQCGGLGIISFTTFTLLILRKKITLKDRILLEEAFNLNSLSGLLRFLTKVFKGTFIVEGVGALISAISFVPVYGPIKGIWFSIFHSVSAFCNAGLDILGPDSLIPFRYDVTLNMVTMLLIILGGLGFPVWFDMVNSAKQMIWKRKPVRNCFRRLSLHSKMVLTFTAVLIVSGTAGIYLLEMNNPLTLGNETIPHKLLMSMFQSVTLRTAGFCTLPQQNLTNAGALISMICMFIGGSPIGTAGGIKTTTAFVLLVSAWCLVKGKQQTTIYGRTISMNSIRKAQGVVIISVGVIGVAFLSLLISEDGNFMDMIFEVISASATVGLSRNVTPGLSTIGKVIIVICMYLGRIGPISLAIALGRKKEVRANFSYPTEDIPIG